MTINGKNITADDVLDSATIGQVIDHINAGIIVYHYDEKHMHIIGINEQMCKMMETDKDFLLSADENIIMSPIHRDDIERTREFTRQLVSGERCEAECVYRLRGYKTGRPRWFHVRGTSHRQSDGTFLMYFVYVDITEQKINEAAYNRGVQMLLQVNKQVIYVVHLNLTKDLCLERHSHFDELHKCSTATEYFDTIIPFLVDDEDIARAKKEFNRHHFLKLYTTGTTHLELVRRCRSKAGNIFWAKIIIQLLMNPATQNIEAVIYAENCDKEHIDFCILDAMSNDVYEVIGIFDARTEIVSYYSSHSDADRELINSGTTHSEKINILCRDITPKQDAERVKKALTVGNIIHVLDSSPSLSVSFKRLDKYEQVTFSYLDEHKDKILFLRRDITQSVHERHKNEELIRSALREAEKANKNKASFLSNISHDLRTPLNAIIGSETLAEESGEATPAIMNYLEKIKQASGTMMMLLNDTLDMQKNQAKAHIKNEPTNFVMLMDDIVEKVKPMMFGKNLNFNYSINRENTLTLMLDPVRIRQILISFLTNSAKYTGAGGSIDLIVEEITRDRIHHTVSERFIVRDTGAGMTDYFVKNSLFKPYAQERIKGTPIETVGGSGLGLSLVKRAIGMMNGHVEVNSKLGKGTEFIISLDFKIVEEEKAPTRPSLPTPARDALDGMNILICEDNEMNSDILAEILHYYGAAHIETARNGNEGVMKFISSPSNSYDVILMDLTMPVVDGFEATRRIRATARADAGTVPILAVSADAYESDIEQAFDSGMNSHISKPVSPEYLVMEILRFTKRN